MSENNNTISKSVMGIQITSLNIDKTRKSSFSTSIYHVYFQLSGIPSQVWKIIFERVWKGMIAASGSKKKKIDVDIDRGFLVLHCPLKEVANLHLPVIKEAIATTNKEYDEYSRQQELEHTRRENIWKEERKEVNEMAEALHF